MSVALNNSSDGLYFGENLLQAFSQWYDPIHIPLSVAICSFGTACNALNIVVLTRAYLRTPINVLLTGLSLAQLALTANYVGLLIYQALRQQCMRALWTEYGAWFMLINVNLNVVFHTTAFGHTVLVALFRFVAIKWPTHMGPHMTIINARRTSLFIWLFVPVLCTPVFLTSKVSIKPDYLNCSLSFIFDLDYRPNPLLLSIVFWLFGILFKLVPSIVLSVLVAALVHSLKAVDKRRKHTLHMLVNNKDKRSKRVAKPRTTRMLVCVVLLCVSVEFPHGIINLLTGIYGQEFGVRYYDHLGNAFEMLTLLYSSINFVLYCAMSTEFLRTFVRLFCPCVSWREYQPVPVVNASPAKTINAPEFVNLELQTNRESTALITKDEA